MMKMKKALVSVFLGAAVITLSASSHASNMMTMHGASCQPYYPSESTPNLYRSTYGIRNTGPNYAALLCPLTRGNGNSYAGGNLSAYWTKGASTLALYCGAYSVDGYGNVIGSAPGFNYTLANSSGGNNFAHLPSLPGSNYVVFCSLPPGDTVTSLDLGE